MPRSQPSALYELIYSKATHLTPSHLDIFSALLCRYFIYEQKVDTCLALS